MNNSERVALNTLFLYANMIVTLVVQLIAVRLVLNALGLVDYGIYNVVAGVVSMFSFLNVAMAAATQRFLSFDMGSGNKSQLKETFYQSVLLHIIICMLAVIALETIGYIYVEHYLNAPSERIDAAKILLHCITASTALNIITVPYEAAINANENMGAIAVINIFDSLFKLATAVIIGHYQGDRLILYGILTMGSLCLTLIIKRVYCLVHYQESHFKWHKPKGLTQAKAMVSFASWNLLGAGCGIARFQGTSIALNAIFGILLNAAYGIAQQVNGLLLFFANTIVRAIRPLIVKSEGAGNRNKMLSLSTTTCKITSLMVAFLAIPLYAEMEIVLKVWLHQSPSPACLVFCRSFLLIVLINQLTIGLQIALESVGRIKALQCIVGAMHILPLIVGYLLMKKWPHYEIIMWCIIAEELIGIILRCIICHRQAGLSIKTFISSTIIPCITCIGGCLIIALFIHNTLQHYPFLSACCVTIINSLLLLFIGYCFILSHKEKEYIMSIVNRAKQMVLKR